MPKKNKQHARYTFRKQRQEPRESIINYTARLREKAKDCEFGDQTVDRILEQLIQTIKDNDLIKKSIQKSWPLDQFLEEASQKEDINQKVKDMKEDYKISKVKHQWGKSQRDVIGGASSSLPEKKPPPQENRKQEHQKEERSSKNSCQYGVKNTTPSPWT